MPNLQFDAQRMEIIDPSAGPVELSLFRSFSDTTPETVTLDDMLDSINGGEWHTEVWGVRSGTHDKRALPCVTVSGVFAGGHKAEHLVKHSGLICLDFDAKDNPTLAGGLDALREDLGHDEFVRAAFTSAGGNGLAVICRVEPERHGEAFDALSEHFWRNHGLKADKACRDVSRLRFVSWDTEMVANESARVFKRYSLARESSQEPAGATIAAIGHMTPSRRSEIAQALSVLSPDDYDRWIRVGMSLHSEAPGMDGLALWREWSEYQDTTGKFDPEACGKKWASFGRRTSGEHVGMESVFKEAYASGWRGPSAVASPHQPTGKAPEFSVDVCNVWALSEEPPRDPIIEGLFDRGDKGDIIAPSKMRKTFFVLQLGMHVAVGRDWLGMECKKPRKVLIVQFEIQRAWMRRRMGSMLRSLNIPANQLANLHVANLRGSYGTGVLQPIVEYVGQHGIDLVIFDPLYKLSDGDETISDFKPIMASFDRLMGETGAAVVWVHHDAKGNAGDRDIRDRGAGSGVLGRDCDFRIALTPQADHPDQVVIDMMPRNFAPIESRVLQFQDGAFHPVDAAPNPKTSKTQTSKRNPATVTADELFEVLRDRPYPSTKSQLRALLPAALKLPTGNRTQALIDSMDALFARDGRLMWGELPKWPVTPNPAGRSKSASHGWGTAAQFEQERHDREASELNNMEI